MDFLLVYHEHEYNDGFIKLAASTIYVHPVII